MGAQTVWTWHHGQAVEEGPWAAVVEVEQALGSTARSLQHLRAGMTAAIVAAAGQGGQEVGMGSRPG